MKEPDGVGGGEVVILTRSLLLNCEGRRYQRTKLSRSHIKSAFGSHDTAHVLDLGVGFMEGGKPENLKRNPRNTERRPTIVTYPAIIPSNRERHRANFTRHGDKQLLHMIRLLHMSACGDK